MSGLSVGDSAKSQERQYPTAGWDNLLQVGAQCLPALEKKSIIYSMNDVTLKHCISGFCSFISALRADSSEEFLANHTSLRISCLCNSLCAGADDLQQRGASPSWGGYCLLWDFPAGSGRN